MIRLLVLASTLSLLSCGAQESAVTGAQFERIPAEVSGIAFRNDLEHRDGFNIYTYRNFYNGGGVGIGDLNGDSLPDIVLTANMGTNRLYLNQGGMVFRDGTDAAGIGGGQGWSTGVTLADVNADGALDVYVCNSGDVDGDDRLNELYINDGAGVFTEAAADYGIADPGYSTHAAFFDYDRDGDLDLYLLNNSFDPIGTFNLSKRLRGVRDTLGGDKFFKNLLVETGATSFEDVSEAVGIYQSVIGFGLGVTVGDVDLDGWPDIYVSNDFFERDYLYRNTGQGTFEEVLEAYVPSTSAASMGADMADLNGDGYPEIFVTDMLPADERRLKLNTTFESYDNYAQKFDNGYHRQFTRNTLQVNRGGRGFSELGRLYGLEATDWSWGALMVDLDADGDRDVFVANGIYQDLTNQDYIRFLSSSEAKSQVIKDGVVDFEALVAMIPSEPVPNVAFENLGAGRGFRRDTTSFGLADPGFSNGAAYGDLDGDGDLDLVVNNVNDEAWLYENTAPRDTLHHSLTLRLSGDPGNVYGVGARATVYADGGMQSGELIPTRGFQSSMEPVLFFGLGAAESADSVIVYWPSGKVSRLFDVRPGRHLVVASRAEPRPIGQSRALYPALVSGSGFAERRPETIGIDFVHEETKYQDWNRERLVVHAASTLGPALAVGDVDGDGREDVYIGGGGDQAGRLYLQRGRGRFEGSPQTAIDKAAKYEDADAVFVDADGDGDLDLVVASGSSEYAPSQLRLRNRLYLNDGRGGLSEAPRSLFPGGRDITSAIAAGDFDGDGDVDVFAGTRQRFAAYGAPAASQLLVNDGTGAYESSEVTALDTLGLVTDASAVDVDGDGVPELLIAREWGAPLVLDYAGGEWVVRRDLTEAVPSGWWSAVAVADLDGDGDEDAVLGNHGLNSRFRASALSPLAMLVGDFDGNGAPEQIVSRSADGADVPLALRHDLVMQMPSLKKRFLRYDSYYGKSVADIFSAEQTEGAYRSEVTELRSGWLENRGGRFVYHAFPLAAQNSPVYAALPLPGGRRRVLLAGNLDGAKPEVGRYDASHGVVVEGFGGELTARELPDLDLRGDIRALASVSVDGRAALLVARNNDAPQLFTSAHETE